MTLFLLDRPYIVYPVFDLLCVSECTNLLITSGQIHSLALRQIERHVGHVSYLAFTKGISLHFVVYSFDTRALFSFHASTLWIIATFTVPFPN